MTDSETLQLLKADIERSALNVSAYAREIEIPQQTLWAALNGTRPLGDKLLEAVGLRRLITRGPQSRF
jgi:hypothetical protein